MKRSKRYKLEIEKVDRSKKYSIEEALDLALKTSSSTNFDSTLDVQIGLKLKDKQKKESIRGTISFPHSIGEAPVVAVIADTSDQKKAKKAGADHVGMEDLIEKIEKGWTEFDVLIATPAVMAKVAKLGKVIGAKGLMPNPKNGTVTDDVEKAVESFKAGKTNFKMSEGGMFQISFAKASMKEEQIKENLRELLSAVKESSRKLGENVMKSMVISSSMGPGIKVDISSLESL